METLNLKLQAQQYTTCRIFRTVNQITKLKRPMTDLPAMIDLQEANGLEMGRILQPNQACTVICHLIDNEIRNNLISM
jgi:hypothetical protein